MITKSPSFLKALDMGLMLTCILDWIFWDSPKSIPEFWSCGLGSVLDTAKTYSLFLQIVPNNSKVAKITKQMYVQCACMMVAHRGLVQIYTCHMYKTYYLSIFVTYIKLDLFIYLWHAFTLNTPYIHLTMLYLIHSHILYYVAVYFSLF